MLKRGCRCSGHGKKQVPNEAKNDDDDDDGTVQLTSNVLVSFQIGLKPLSWMTLVLLAFLQSLGMPCTDTITYGSMISPC